MITVTTEAFISAQNPVLLLPNIPEGQYDIIVVLQPKVANGKSVSKKPRKAGFIKAKITMSEDFNAPLEDFKEYM